METRRVLRSFLVLIGAFLLAAAIGTPILYFGYQLYPEP